MNMNISVAQSGKGVAILTKASPSHSSAWSIFPLVRVWLQYAFGCSPRLDTWVYMAIPTPVYRNPNDAILSSLCYIFLRKTIVCFSPNVEYESLLPTTNK